MSFNSPIVGISIFLLTVDGLEQLPRTDNVIKDTEETIRITVNKLFSMLNLRDIKNKPRLKEYGTMHKYFVSQSLRDDANSKYVQEITKVRFGNKTSDFNGTDFIAIINEINNEDNAYVTVDDINVIRYINIFIENLKKLRDTYAENTVHVNINTKVLEHLRNIRPKNETIQRDKKDKSEDNVITDDNELWEPSGRRIYKGERTKIIYFPFVASIHLFNSFYCAGSIIKSDLVITASSCLQLAYNNRLFRENPAFLSVRVGSSFYHGGGELIPVLEVYFHPGYDPKTLRNNLSILRLVRHLKFSKANKQLKRIDFDRNAWSLPLTTPGVTILGWGAKGKSGVIFNPWKNLLSFAILDIYPRRDCQDVYSKEFVTKKNFCAGFMSKGGGACNRDVGGPGVVDGKLMGVISFGSPTCGTPDAPTVFTKLGYYTDWIEEIMEKKPISSFVSTTEKLEFDFIQAMLTTERTRITTFKMAPITGKTMKPLSIFDIEKALRLLDEGLFKEFVSTMFTSSEIREYQNRLKNETTQKKTEKQGESISMEVTNAAEFITRMPESEDEVRTVAMGSSSESSESEDSAKSDIVKFMQNVDLKKIIQEEVKVTPHVKFESDKKNKNESVVTFLYLSDNDKNGNIDMPDDEGGLSLQVEDKALTFEDMTRAKSKKKSEYNILPENKLYNWLSDVIGTEVKNKFLRDKKYDIVLFLNILWVCGTVIYIYSVLIMCDLTNHLRSFLGIS